MIKLYHYSNEDFKGYIEPKFFGIHSYTNNSARLNNTLRSYFYKVPEIKEYFLNGTNFLYIGKVNLNKLYDIDSNKIIGNNLYSEVKKKGYIGLYNKFQVVLFKRIKIIEKIELAR